MQGSRTGRGSSGAEPTQKRLQDRVSLWSSGECAPGISEE